MKPKPQNDGIAAGQPIPGSRYVRAFCRCCGEAMRVSKEIFVSGGYSDCSDCTDRNRSHRPSPTTRGPAREYDGSWDNAVRALEDAA